MNDLRLIASTTFGVSGDSFIMQKHVHRHVVHVLGNADVRKNLAGGTSDRDRCFPSSTGGARFAAATGTPYC